MKESDPTPTYPKTGFPYNLTRRLFCEFLLHPLLNIQKHGLENLEIAKETPVIFPYFTHSGHGDVLVAFHALAESGIANFFIPGAKDYFSIYPWLPQLVSLAAPYFPQPRQNKDPRVTNSDVKDANVLEVDLIKRGYSVLMTPEGTRTNLPLKQRKIYSGFADLALKTNSPVIPIIIIGYNDVYPKGTIIPHPLKYPSRSDPDPRKRIDVVFGSPIYPGFEEKTKNKRGLTEATTEVFIETYLQYFKEFHQ